MAQLRQDYATFFEENAEMIVIGPDNEVASARCGEKKNLPFVGLPGLRDKVLKLYRQKVNLFKLGRMPARMIVDRMGQLRFVHYGQSMSDIPPSEELLVLLDELNQGG